MRRELPVVGVGGSFILFIQQYLLHASDVVPVYISGAADVVYK